MGKTLNLSEEEKNEIRAKHKIATDLANSKKVELMKGLQKPEKKEEVKKS